ncbi:cysteine desulfurase family protein [Sphingobacterium faecium]|uniref:cysteine desulfurase family protein n=1 Tax=Sphingobacterium faecium TaxID=34087 RepID=UPI0024699B3E|nr:cysteine desulfurase family protein [Sphingobacterium faecium]MDH5827015.1 cysteine desulfurase family protein [Sphingobacterium faecium]
MDHSYIYLDYNATTPLDDRVLEEMIPYFGSQFANPSSPHLFGMSIQEVLQEATDRVAHLIGAKPNSIIYTSGATEAINLALKGVFSGEKKHIVTFVTEHSAMLETCAYLETVGYSVTYLPVDHEGGVDLEQLKNVVTNKTLLVSAMLVNNETGVILPIKEMAEIAHHSDAMMFCDATQAMGKIPVNVKDLKVDLLAFSAHKFYGPKGIGGLFISKEAKKMMKAQIHGGRQQGGLRSGTLNVPGIIGTAKALILASALMVEEQLRIKELRDLLEIGLLDIDGTRINGHLTNRIYSTTNICFQGVLSERLILNLGQLAVASGSACNAMVTSPSHVLQAMGLSNVDGLSALRFSLGRFTTKEEIEKTIELVKTAVHHLRKNNFN